MTVRTKILIVADSSAMPRENVLYEDTWVYMLREAFPGCDIVDRCARASQTTRLVTEGGGGVDLLERYRPHIVILQMGLAECAPRLFKKKGIEHFFLTRILNKKNRLKYIDFIRKRRIRNPDISYVSPKQFRLNVSGYCQRAKNIGTKIIILLMHGPNKLFVVKSPHVGKNISLYNGIFMEIAEKFSNVSVIEPFDATVEIESIMIDEVHFNRAGSVILCDKLKKKISKMIQSGGSET